MTILDVKPTVLKDVELIFGTTDDYRKHVDQVTFTPSSSTQSWTGLGGNTHTDVSTATWTLNLNYAQDWDSENSLSRYLHAHEGETVDVTFAPKAGGPDVTASVIITPGAIGGTVNQFSTASVTLGVSGKPEIAAAV